MLLQFVAGHDRCEPLHIRDEGFSLVESVVACGVLAAGVLSAVQLFALATTMSVAARQMTSASILASQKLEELRADDAPAPGMDRLDRFGVVVDGGNDGRTIAYRRRWTVTAAGGDLVAIAVAVSPYRAGARDEDDGGLETVRLATLHPGGMP